MAEETEKVEKTTEQDASAETNDAVDYDKELEIVSEKVKNDMNANRRIAAKSEKSEDESDDLAEKIISKILPRLQVTAESASLDVKLEKIAGSNEPLKKLIKFHYENSVNPNMDMDSRVDAANAIANKKFIEKKAKEINISLQNRNQMSNTGQGQSQETYQKPGDNTLSEAQLNDLKKFAKANNLDEKKFIEKAMKNLSTGR